MKLEYRIPEGVTVGLGVGSDVGFDVGDARNK
jgi:hypothetical protein